MKDEKIQKIYGKANISNFKIIKEEDIVEESKNINTKISEDRLKSYGIN